MQPMIPPDPHLEIIDVSLDPTALPNGPRANEPRAPGGRSALLWALLIPVVIVALMVVLMATASDSPVAPVDGPNTTITDGPAVETPTS